MVYLFDYHRVEVPENIQKYVSDLSEQGLVVNSDESLLQKKAGYLSVRALRAATPPSPDVDFSEAPLPASLRDTPATPNLDSPPSQLATPPPGPIGWKPTTDNPGVIALVLWRTYNLNASACVSAQQGELLRLIACLHVFISQLNDAMLACFLRCNS